MNILPAGQHLGVSHRCRDVDYKERVSLKYTRCYNEYAMTKYRAGAILVPLGRVATAPTTAISHLKWQEQAKRSVRLLQTFYNFLE